MSSPNTRLRLDLRGRVQGVGFRPFVWRLAHELALAGRVGNDSHGAYIELEGPPEAVTRFEVRLHAELPPLARVTATVRTPLAPRGETGFTIDASAHDGAQEAEISPDVGTCADCLRELRDPADRRYRYPFINCTNCGPRYSIVEGVPYDRATTTMRAFPMCDACQREYDDPANRRFHAQPNACPLCGPRVWLETTDGERFDDDPLALAAQRLLAGEILAIKGLGGFHLACRADDEEVVERLRHLKGRDCKPFAIMAPDLQAAHRLVELSATEAEVQASWQAPILIAPRRRDSGVAIAAAPQLDTLGVMLPYTPLHHLLLAACNVPLILTSANPAAEPLCADNAEARQRLASMVNAFLMHDRDIARRVDDSVLLATGDSAPLLVRRARGYVPIPIRLPLHVNEPILAVGGDLKSAICLLAGDQAVMSEHLGELDNPAAFRNFVAAIDRLQRLLRVKPGRVAHDLHPGYHASRFARQLGLPTVAVQHHHAHVVAVMAEHQLDGEVLGLSADGTGYGTDGAIWGCELLLARHATFRRLGHLAYVPLVGGDRAAQETWRPALAHLHAAFGDSWRTAAPGLLPEHPAQPLAAQRLAQGTPTSSLGRLFDAAAGLLGICTVNSYEAEAAIRLETVARLANGSPSPLAWELHESPDGLRLDPRPIIRDLVSRRLAGESLEAIALAFHHALADMLAAALLRLAEVHGNPPIILSGGCMLNRLLLSRLRATLVAAGQRVCVPSAIPPGDGAIALGQALIAAARLQQHD